MSLFGAIRAEMASETDPDPFRLLDYIHRLVAASQ